jgi:hypothetical protein
MQILVVLAGWFVVSVITGLVLGRLLRQFGWEHRQCLDAGRGSEVCRA